MIFVSIDDNEVHNLRMIMNEIFGEENFISCVIWQHSVQGKNDAKTFSLHHNYILIYSKSMECEILRMSRTEEHNVNYSNPDNDPKGPWRSGDVRSPHLRKNLKFIIKTPKGKIISPPENGWRWTKQQVQEKIKSGEIVFSEKQDRIIRKIYLCEQKGRVPETIWFGKDAGTTREANQEIKDLFEGNSPFDTPKPVPLIKRMLNISCETGDIVLDFFAGSCTTADAVMQLNAEDGGNRKFICVQLPEACDKDSEAAKAGFATIADIGRERIRRAAKKIGEESKGKLDFDGGTLDLGFKAFRLEESNFKPWCGVFKDAAELEKALTLFVDNVRDGAVSEDILYELILKAGLDVNVPVETKKRYGKTYYCLDGGRLIVCLEEKITQTLVDAILAERPQQLITLDRAFAGNDQLKTNTALQLEAEKIEFKVI